MNCEFKVGDLVRCVSISVFDTYCKNKIGRIIRIDSFNVLPYSVKFFEYIKEHDGKGGRNKYYNRFDKDEIELYKQPILKLFLKSKKSKHGYQ